MNVETGKGCGDVCEGKIDIPTDKEVKALNAMRSIKSKVKTLKESMKKLAGSDNEEDKLRILELEKDLENHREEWNKWQQKHKEAVRERMIILGHEK